MKLEVVNNHRNHKEMMMSDVKDLIQHALDQDYNNASKAFGSIMQIKMSDLLDQEQIKLADQVYNGADPDEDDDSQLELDFETEDDDEETEEGILQEPDSLQPSEEEYEEEELNISPE